MSMISDGMRVLRDWRERHMAEAIEYHGVNGVTPIAARVGFSVASELDGLGDGIIETRYVDFIFAAGLVEPRIGDTIVWNRRRHRLSSKNGQPCWRSADNHSVSIRIHTTDEGPA